MISRAVGVSGAGRGSCKMLALPEHIRQGTRRIEGTDVPARQILRCSRCGGCGNAKDGKRFIRYHATCPIGTTRVKKRCLTTRERQAIAAYVPYESLPPNKRRKHVHAMLVCDDFA